MKISIQAESISFRGRVFNFIISLSLTHDILSKTNKIISDRRLVMCTEHQP